MDKIKNILYESSDVILGLFILVLMVCTVGWQLYNWFDPNLEYAASVTGTASKNSVSQSSSGSSSDSKGVSDDSENPSEDSVQTPNVEEIVIFQIARGSACIAIANNLQSMGLVSSSDEFIAAINSMGLESKLKSGSYSIKKGESLENIIHILTD